MDKLLKILALVVPLLGLIAYVASPDVRARLPLNVLIALTFGFWLVLFVVRLATHRVSPEEADANQRMHGLGGDTAHWTAARATVAQFRSTGVRYGKQMMVEFDLEVERPGGAPHKVRHTQVVPRLAEGRVAPGVVLAVKVDPSDPQKVFIDWEQTFPGVMPRH
jgi:hypothetical protein